MKKLFAIAALVLASSLAFALPAPKDIEAAVSAGQLGRAEEMLKEVIAAKPGSARAHYELGQVLERAGRKIEARDELETAKRLDPALKFAHDPQHFNDMLKRLSGTGGTAGGAVLQSPRADAAAASISAPVQVPSAPSIPWGMVLIGGGALVGVWLLMRRRAAPAGGGAMLAGASAGAGGGVVPASAGYGPGVGQGYGAPQAAPGMGIGGAVLGGVAGLAAGYGLAKVLEHGDERPHAAAGNESGFTPITQAPQEDFGSFDAGNGDSWDSVDGGDAGGDDDGW